MSESSQKTKPGLSRTSLICGGLLWTAVFCSIGFLWQNRQSEADAATQSSEGGKVASAPKTSVNISFPARKLPDFKFAECMGGTVSLDDLKGRPWVASFVFTRCASTCPIITASVMKLHNQVIDKNPDVVMVTITVDPKFDTAEIMKTYSETFQPNRDRWKFLTGDQQEIYELVVNGFGMYVKENLGKMRLPGFEVAHTNRVILVNKEGTPVGTFLGTKDEDMVKLRRILTGTDDFPEPGPPLKITSTSGGPLAIKFDVKPVEDVEVEGEPSADSDVEPADVDVNDSGSPSDAIPASNALSAEKKN